MKIAILIARIVLGLMFLVFGLNGLLHFMPNPPMPPSDAVTMLTILGTHKYLTVIGILMIIGGVLILVGRYVPLGLTLIGPILVNILLIHLTLMGGHGIALGLVATVLWFFLFVVYRASFYGLFAADPLPATKL